MRQAHPLALGIGRKARPSGGFTLIEVLVALVVLAVGMLGIGRLMLYTLQGNSSATSRTIAVNLVADMADRIRANRSATLNYAGASPIATAPTPACAGTAVNFAAASCTAAQMALYDLYQWDTQVRCVGSPSCWAANPTWSVTYVANAAGVGPNAYTITINWLEQATNQALTYSVVVII